MLSLEQNSQCEHAADSLGWKLWASLSGTRGLLHSSHFSKTSSLSRQLHTSRLQLYSVLEEDVSCSTVLQVGHPV